MNERREVTLRYDPDAIGLVVREGPTTSEVKFTRAPWSALKYFVNSHLVDADGKSVEPKAAPAVAASASAKIDYKANGISVVVEGNPRSPTAKAFTKWAEMKAHLAAHPKASIKEVADATSYKIGDFRWDLEKGNVAVKPLEGK